MRRRGWVARRSGAIAVLALLGLALAFRGRDGVRGAVVTRSIDLNSAPAAELELLPGVGPSLAAAIVADRGAQGPFDSVDALDRVRGIGPAVLARIRPHAVVAPSARVYAAR